MPQGDIVSNGLEYAKGAQEQSEHQVGYFEGKRDAFRDMVRQLDPMVTCQDCGYEYYTERHGYGLTKEDHDSKCEKRQERLNPPKPGTRPKKE